MSKALLSRPVPIGLLVADPSRPKSCQSPDLARPARIHAPPPLPSARPRTDPAVWLGPALVGAAVGLLLVAGAGATADALQPVNQTITETAYTPPPPPEPPAAATPHPDPEPAPVDPGEARPTPKGLVVAAPVEAPPEPAKPVCARFGTAIDFVRSPSVAFDRAAREQKLVLVLHLAGNFEDPGFT